MSDDMICSASGALGEVLHRENALLDIFSEEDRHCHNLYEMKATLTKCFNTLQAEVESNAQSLASIPSDFLTTIGAFLRGEELSHTEGTLVADMDALPEEIRQKIKQGIYHIGESKQIEGNMRADVVDKNNKIVKSITLKHAEGNKLVADDLNTLAIQAALRQITQQLECIDAGIQYLTKLNRRSNLQTPYFNAVQKIIEAKSAENEEEQNERVRSAVDDLTQGLNSLYGDLNDCLGILSGKWIPVASKRNLNYIAEDMVFIPQYVALRSYLYNFLGKGDLAIDCIQTYNDKISCFMNEKITGDYTAAQLVHSHFHYNETNRDFWIDGMKKIQSEIVKLELLPTTNKERNAVYYLSFEDVLEGKNNV